MDNVISKKRLDGLFIDFRSNMCLKYSYDRLIIKLEREIQTFKIYLN